MEMLSKSIDGHTQDDWDEYLPVVQFAFNTSVHSSTDLQPFCLHFGREPMTLLDVFFRNTEDRVNKPIDCLKELKARIRHGIALAQERLSNSILKKKQGYVKKAIFGIMKRDTSSYQWNVSALKILSRRCGKIDG